MLKQHVWIKTECCNKIDPIERWLEKSWNGGGDDKPDDDFEREPYIAHKLHVEKCLVGERLWLVQRPVGSVEVVSLLTIMGLRNNFAAILKSKMSKITWTVTFFITGTRKFGCVFKQNETIDVTMNNTEAMLIIWKYE